MYYSSLITCGISLASWIVSDDNRNTDIWVVSGRQFVEYCTDQALPHSASEPPMRQVGYWSCRSPSRLEKFKYFVQVAEAGFKPMSLCLPKPMHITTTKCHLAFCIKDSVVVLASAFSTGLWDSQNYDTSRRNSWIGRQKYEFNVQWWSRTPQSEMGCLFSKSKSSKNIFSKQVSEKDPLLKYLKHKHKRTFWKKQWKLHLPCHPEIATICLRCYLDKTRLLEFNKINPKRYPLGWSTDLFMYFSLQCSWLAVFIPVWKPRKETPERFSNVPGSWEYGCEGRE